MKPELKTVDWLEEDHKVAAENAEIIQLYQAHQEDIAVPDLLDRRIRELARQQEQEPLTSDWLFGQGPWVILVTCILFIVALMVLSIG